MRILIITQNDPFYIKDNLSYLFSILPEKSKVVGCVVSDVSPFGKQEKFRRKGIKTVKIFGIKFFLYYSFKYLFSKLFKQSLKNFLLKKQIAYIKPSSNINSKTTLKKVQSFNPDLLISILGNQIFKKELIDLAPKGCINLHTALLPKYRGLMPTFWVLRYNEEFTGVSVFFVDEGIDSGPIIIQKKIKIETRIHAELIRKTKKIGMEAIAEAVDNIMNNKVKLTSNNEKENTYFSFPKKQDVIEFKKRGNKFY